jgi:eukaryotic-like serine/threonine-protein kinase
MEHVVDPSVFHPKLLRPVQALPKRGTLVADRYRLGDDIGEGGMSTVFSARDERLGRDVAFKLLNPELASSQEVVTRFVNEARMLAQLDCPHVVRLFDAGVMDQPGQPTLPFMVLELLRGCELRSSSLEPGGTDVHRIVDWMLQVCAGLAAAHVEGIIHRDLKPENLFVVHEPDGSQIVKVLDFGIARSMQVASSLTFHGERMGSPGYMSPEQVIDASSADERSDIWSLGVIMYELFAGVVPFQAQSQLELCVQILNFPIDPLDARRPDLPPGLAQVVERCMQRPVAARFNNIADLAEALAPYAGPRSADVVKRIRYRLASRVTTELAPPISAPVSAKHHAPPLPRLPPGIQLPVSAPARRGRGYRMAWALAAAVGVLSLGTLLLSATRSRELVSASSELVTLARGFLGISDRSAEPLH